MDRKGLTLKRNSRFVIALLAMVSLTVLLPTEFNQLYGSKYARSVYYSDFPTSTAKPTFNITLLNVIAESSEDDNSNEGNNLVVDSKYKVLKHQPKMRWLLRKMENKPGGKKAYPFVNPIFPNAIKYNGTKQCRRLKDMPSVPPVCVNDINLPSGLLEDIRNSYHEIHPSLTLFTRILRMHKHVGVLDIGAPLPVCAAIADAYKRKSVVLTPHLNSFSAFTATSDVNKYADSVFCFKNIIERKRRHLRIETAIEFDSLYQIVTPKDEGFNNSVPASSIRLKDIPLLAPFPTAVLCLDLRGGSLESLIELPAVLDSMDIVAFVFDWTRLRDIRQFDAGNTDTIAKFMIDELTKRDYQYISLNERVVDKANLFEANIVWVKKEKYSSLNAIMKESIIDQPKFDWYEYSK